MIDMFGWKTLTSGQKRVWGMGAGVLAFGGLVKFGYFYLSRSLIIDSLEERDKNARVYLKESRDFGNWAFDDRRKRLPPLTDEQRDQLQNYLILMAKHNHDVYPTESDKWSSERRR